MRQRARLRRTPPAPGRKRHPECGHVEQWTGHTAGSQSVSSLRLAQGTACRGPGPAVHATSDIDNTVIVHSMDRLAHNLDDLRRLVRTLTRKGVWVSTVAARPARPDPPPARPSATPSAPTPQRPRRPGSPAPATAAPRPSSASRRSTTSRSARPAVRHTPPASVDRAETTPPTHPRLPFLSGKRVPAPPPAEVAGRPGGLTAAAQGCMVSYTCS